MNVYEMLNHIRSHYPAFTLETQFGLDIEDRFQVTMPNGWHVSAGFGNRHGGVSIGFTDIFETDRVEIAIFKPDGDWYIPESANDVYHESARRTGVLSWQDSKQLFSIIDYIADM